jgi:hypothetical protein
MNISLDDRMSKLDFAHKTDARNADRTYVLRLSPMPQSWFAVVFYKIIVFARLSVANPNPSAKIGVANSAWPRKRYHALVYHSRSLLKAGGSFA